MNDKDTPVILRAKLHRPQVTHDLLCRARLHKKMDDGLALPLSLVSAPAGYGKSILVSHWVDSLDRKCAWLSLDESDGDLIVFLNYFIAAIQSALPAACNTVKSLLEGGDLPPVLSVGHALINDLDEINEPFVFVLDDYHRISNPEVDELIRLILSHPPGKLHLVIVTRRDPPLSLSTLRGLGTMHEVRLGDLEFTLTETETFLGQLPITQVSKKDLKNLHERVEGWPVGLRLVRLALMDNETPKPLLTGMSGGFGAVQRFLLNEVLAKQAPKIRSALLKSSVLDRFCTQLCDAVFENTGEDDDQIVTGEEFLTAVTRGELFSISLDFGGEWYRFHHQFQDLLQDQLSVEDSKRAIDTLYERASNWYESKELIDEALTYALKMEDKSNAVRLVLENGGNLLLTEQNTRMESWLKKLPEAVISSEPMLIVLSGYMDHVRYRLPEWELAIQRADDLIGVMDLPEESKVPLRGCVDAIRASYCFFMSDLEGAIVNARNAIKHVPPELIRLRLHAIAVLGCTLQISGRQKKAIDILKEQSARPEYQTPEARVMLAGTHCVICQLDGSFSEMKRCAMRIQVSAKDTQASVYKLYGRLYLSVSAYFCNQLAEVDRELGLEISDPHKQHNIVLVDWAALLVFTHLAQNRLDEAQTIVNQISDYSLEVSNIEMINTLQALQAEISIRRGDLDKATRWATTCEPRKLQPQIGFYLPELSLARVLVFSSEESHWSRAEEVLTDIEAYARSSHFRTVLISALGLKAILLDKTGRQAEAVEVLGEALAEAEPDNGLRLFLDHGRPMADLLRRWQSENSSSPFVQLLLREFETKEEQLKINIVESTANEPESTEAIPPGNLLTPRELDILELLQQRRRDKEIANQLFISTETVKSHLKNIYQKLAVSNRMQAVTKVETLKTQSPN